MDYSWISAAVVERLATMNCTKSVSDLELSISICRHWLMSDFFCTLVSHPLILERFLTVSIGWMGEISISFLGVAPKCKLSHILFWKFVKTRSYAALRAADLDWIIGPGYSSGGNKQKRDWRGVTTDLGRGQGRNKQKRHRHFSSVTQGHNWPFRCLDWIWWVLWLFELDGHVCLHT